MRFLAAVTSKGQITIPKQIRDRLELAEGDAVVFVPFDHGVMMIPRNKPVERIFGLLSAYAIPGMSTEDYDKAVRDAVSEHADASSRFRSDNAA